MVVTQKINVSSAVIEKLKTIPNPSNGKLLGVSSEQSITILGFSVLEAQNVSPDYLNFPTNMSLCGVFYTHWEDESDAGVIKEADQNGVVLLVTAKELQVNAAFVNNPTETIPYDILTRSQINKRFIYLQLMGKVPLLCVADVKHVTDSLLNFQNKVQSGGALFQLRGKDDVYLLSDTKVQFETGPLTVKELIKDQSVQKSDNVIHIPVSLFVTETKPEPSAFIISSVKQEYKCVRMTINIDTLSVVAVDTKVQDLYKILVDSVSRAITINSQCLITQEKLSTPQFYHFLVEELAHFVTVAYPSDVMEDVLVPEREKLHKTFNLPTTRPYFRRCCSHSFNPPVNTSQTVHLLNPHVGVAPSGVQDGEVSMVQGTYSYHHYMQDNFDDSGWGCAYRSLQTLFSWFRFQGYTNAPVPSLTEIQKCLVKIGDKPSSFVGTRDWIGSTEVAFCLDTMLGVSCRIIAVSSGQELSTKGGELVYHFKTQGTPVMIGGGQYAYTIVGVDYNKKTGALKFMVLDPHCTGPDDINIIHTKGWCAWKGLEFWKKDCFYNLCLPLRPKCI